MSNSKILRPNVRQFNQNIYCSPLKILSTVATPGQQMESLCLTDMILL
jgi:hypothetical protein